MSYYQLGSQTITQDSTLATLTTDFGPVFGDFVAVSYERPAANAVSTSSLMTIGRGTTADIVVSFFPTGDTEVNTLYPVAEIHNSAGALLVSTDGHTGGRKPFVDQTIISSIVAGSSLTDRTVDLTFYWNGPDLGLASTT